MLFVLLINTLKTNAQRQRIIAECTSGYTIKIDSNSIDKSASSNILGQSKTVYIKANRSRVDVVSPAFNQSVFFDQSTGSATILCKKAILSYKSGEVIYLYVTTEIMPSVREFEYQFKDISGLILEYESIESGGLKVNCTAVKIDLSPVQASIFNIPTSGYRVLN